MGTNLRQFDTHLSDGVQTVEILDVLTYEGKIHLVVKGIRDKPHVLQVRPTGLLVVPSDLAEVVVALHEQEVERWQTESSEVVSSSTS